MTDTTQTLTLNEYLLLVANSLYTKRWPSYNRMNVPQQDVNKDVVKEGIYNAGINLERLYMYRIGYTYETSWKGEWAEKGAT